MRKAIILAVDDNWGIGKDGKLPWHIPEDMKFFSSETKNSICIMGYNTYKEIADKFNYEKTGKFLPNRLCYVITQKRIPETDNVKQFTSLEAAFDESKKHEKNVFFIGGFGIFKEAMSYIDKMYITNVFGKFDCDVSFNPFDEIDMRRIESSQMLLESDKFTIIEYDLIDTVGV